MKICTPEFFVFFLQIVAVVSRSQDTAEKFATTFDIPKTYSSYEKFAADPEIGNAIV